MKKITCLLLLFICLSKAYAQDKKVEISADLISYRKFPELVDFNKFKLVPLNGFNITIQKNKFYQNLGLNIFILKDYVNIDKKIIDFYSGIGNYKAFSLYYGLYRNFEIKKFNIEIGGDLYNLISKYSANFDDLCSPNDGIVNSNSLRIGLRPSIVFRFQFNNKISVFIKESFEVYYSFMQVGRIDFLADYLNSFGITYRLK